MSAQEIIAELPHLSSEDQQMILDRLLHLTGPFSTSSAMDEAVREGFRSLREENTFSAAELRSRIAAFTSVSADRTDTEKLPSYLEEE